jgi:hypothetical protein
MKFLPRSALSPVAYAKNPLRPTTGERQPGTIDSVISRGFDDV